MGSVWVIGIDGSGERPVLAGIETHPKSPTWSPDGQQIAFNMQLAGGQQQRLARTRAMANQPQLILADEPTGELDTATAREILDLFQHIVTEEGATILMMSHDNLVYDYVDQVLRLRDGQIVDEN